MSHSPGQMSCLYHLFVWSNLDFLHNSQWITLPTQSFLVLYSFRASLLHSLIMCMIVLCLSLYHLHLLFLLGFISSCLGMIGPHGVILS